MFALNVQNVNFRCTNVHIHDCTMRANFWKMPENSPAPLTYTKIAPFVFFEFASSVFSKTSACGPGTIQNFKSL